MNFVPSFYSIFRSRDGDAFLGVPCMYLIGRGSTLVPLRDQRPEKVLLRARRHSGRHRNHAVSNPVWGENSGVRTNP